MQIKRCTKTSVQEKLEEIIDKETGDRETGERKRNRGQRNRGRFLVPYFWNEEPSPVPLLIIWYDTLLATAHFGEPLSQYNVFRNGNICTVFGNIRCVCLIIAGFFDRV